MGNNPKISSGIKNAADLGIKADSMGILKRKAKTHKGRKIMESKEAKLIEDLKKSIIMKGMKTSQTVMDLMKDLHLQRGTDLSKLFLRTGKDLHPFDDIGPIEQMANKQGSALFVLGTHQKKRPDNIIFGRMFAEHLLDMCEFGVTGYVSQKEFKSMEVTNNLKPILIFQGEQFDFNDKHRRFKNYLIDFFKVSDYEEVNIAELKRVMVFTSVGEKTIHHKQFEINVGKQVNITDVTNNTISMHEIGPRYTLNVRRDKIATIELYKEACKQPKIGNFESRKAAKNMYTNNFGEKMGKVYL